VNWIWTVVIVAYLVIGFKRIPVYYKRVDEHNANEYPSWYRDGGMHTTILWLTLGLCLVWPLYEVFTAITRFMTWYIVRILKAKA
jgi:hypothetical protein